VRTDFLHRLRNVARFQHHLHQGHVLFIHLWSHLGFYGFFHDVIDRETQSYTRESASPGGVAFGDRHGIQAAAFRIRRTQQHQEFVWLVALRNAFDFFLTFQVKSAGSRSDKAIGRLQHYFCPSTLGAGSNSAALHAVALSQSNNFFSL
jgi:hypothetical protein